MKVESISECCNTYDLHLAIIGLENQFLTFEWTFNAGFTVLYYRLQLSNNLKERSSEK